MIIISVGAGLGNQMFEYSFFLRMKSVYPETGIFIDPDYAFPSAHNGYELESVFGIQAEKTDKKNVFRYGDAAYLLNSSEKNLLVNKIRRKLGIKKSSFFAQKDFTEYYPELLSLDISKSWYLFGPFANSAYFSEIEDEIKGRFVFPDIDKHNEQLAWGITHSESVSIHVRRGDYVEWGIDTLSKEYYHRAIELIIEKKGIPKEKIRFFVFSDDEKYVKELFCGVDNVNYVTGNTGLNSFRDMQLMSLCKHNIIADSTFSFWGAYLNKNPDKIVVGPNRPFKGCKNPFSCDDWFRL